MRPVEVFVDGAALGNPGPGGWAALLRYGAHEKFISGYELHTTNNRMELMALLKALEALKEPCRVTVTTDSQYLIGVLRDGWKRRANHDLLHEIDRLLAPHAVEFVWVPGHSGHPENERVNQEARAAAERAKSAAVLQEGNYQ